MHYRGFFSETLRFYHIMYQKKFKTHGNALNTPNRLSVIVHQILMNFLKSYRRQEI